VYTVHPTFEDGSDTGFQNVGQLQFDAGEIPKRKYTIFKSRRKSEIKNTSPLWGGYSFIYMSPRETSHQGQLQFDAGEIPKRKYTKLYSRRN